ncbi:MAG: hypothetical protein WDW36_004413 [Sanguina aurantia]
MSGNGPVYRSDVAAPPLLTSLDTAVNRRLIAQLRGDKPAHQAGSASDADISNSNSNAGLVMSMAKRLGVLEKASQRHASLVHTLQTENDALKRKLRVAEDEIALRAAAPSGKLQNDKAWLCSQLEAAQAQVAELKDFLSDYGMVWVGGDDSTPRVSSRSSPSTGSTTLPTGASSWNPTIDRPASARPRFARACSPTPPSQGPPQPAIPEALRSAPADGNAPLPPSHPPGLRPLSAASSSRVLLNPLPPPSAPPSSPRTALDLPHPPPTQPAPTRPPPTTAPPTPTSPHHPPPHPSHHHPHRDAHTTAPSTAAPPAPAPFRLPFDATLEELRARVDDLNGLVGDGVGVVAPTPGPGHAHGIVTQQPVHMVLFRDGIQVHRAAARPFSDAVCRAVLRDILDGYFPALLKAEFPDGVPITLLERTSDGIADAPVHGGNGVGAGGSNVRTFAELGAGDRASGPVTRDRFLERLPAAVIRNGRVVDIRQEVGRMLGLPLPLPLRGGGALGGAGPVLPAAPDGCSASGGRPPAAEVTTLQVKSEDGSETLLLRLQFDDTIASLRRCIDAHRGGGGGSGPVTARPGRPGSAGGPAHGAGWGGAGTGAVGGGRGSDRPRYEIRTAFPSRVCACETETLREAGLVPNATLFLKSIV